MVFCIIVIFLFFKFFIFLNKGVVLVLERVVEKVEVNFVVMEEKFNKVINIYIFVISCFNLVFGD